MWRLMQGMEEPQQKQTVSVWISSGCFKGATKQAGALVSVEVHASVVDVGPAEAADAQAG